MSEPLVGKYPIEVFGYPFNDLSDSANQTRQHQHCPYLNGECKKPRKSEPHVKIGTCTVGYSSSFYDGFQPVIICPHRFEVSVFEDFLAQRHFATNNNFPTTWLTEVSLGQHVGTVDFVGVNHIGDAIHDFVCVEVQAAGTTGSPWQAVVDLLTYGEFRHNNYKYGINWANEFAKTMMQQAYKKGLLLEAWRKHLVFVVQDIGLRYLQSAYDTSDLVPFDPESSIHFLAISMQWDDSSQRWVQRVSKELSTTTVGIRKILGGLNADDHPRQEDFIEILKSKLK